MNEGAILDAALSVDYQQEGQEQVKLTQCLRKFHLYLLMLPYSYLGKPASKPADKEWIQKMTPCSSLLFIILYYDHSSPFAIQFCHLCIILDVQQLLPLRFL